MPLLPLSIGLLLLVAAESLQSGGPPDTVDADANFKQVLSMLFGNNVELTRKAIKMVDWIPSDPRNRRHALNFVRAHYSENAKVSLKVDSGEPISLEEFMESDRVSPSRVVLAIYLMTLIHKTVSSQPPEFVMPNGTVSHNICAQMEPKTFLNRCPSPCEPCEKYPRIHPIKNNATTRSKLIELGAFPSTSDEHFPRTPESWFFSETEMRQFQKIVDESDFHWGNTPVANHFDRFLITIPSLNAKQLPDHYYENMLALLASVGIPMSRQRYEQFRRPPETPTESGFLALISRLTLLARQFRPRMRNKPCDIPYFCQLDACPIDGTLVQSSPSLARHRPTSGDITCLWCSR